MYRPPQRQAHKRRNRLISTWFVWDGRTRRPMRVGRNRTEPDNFDIRSPLGRELLLAGNSSAGEGSRVMTFRLSDGRARVGNRPQRSAHSVDALSRTSRLRVHVSALRHELRRFPSRGAVCARRSAGGMQPSSRKEGASFPCTPRWRGRRRGRRLHTRAAKVLAAAMSANALIGGRACVPGSRRRQATTSNMKAPSRRVSVGGRRARRGSRRRARTAPRRSRTSRPSGTRPRAG